MKDDHFKFCLIILVWGVISALNVWVGALFIVLVIILGGLFSRKYYVSPSSKNDLHIIHPKMVNIGDEVQLVASTYVARRIKPNIQIEESWKFEGKYEEHVLNPYTRRDQNDGNVKIFCHVVE